MTNEQDFRLLLRRATLTSLAGLAVVVFCYFWIDRPVAFFVHRHEIEKFNVWKINVFKWLTDPPPIMQTWSPLVLALLMTRRTWGPLKLWQHTLFAASLSLIVADEFRHFLGDLCGRYWPETWFNNNPSLIGDGTYGFHPFAGGDDIGSFPSGHAARIAGFATVWCIAMPRGRVFWIIVCLPMLVSLVAMNYHFVSDVIAGCVLGAIVGMYAACLAHLEPSMDRESRIAA
jgi:membrane-associated phospholipid phosphatase